MLVSPILVQAASYHLAAACTTCKPMNGSNVRDKASCLAGASHFCPTLHLDLSCFQQLAVLKSRINIVVSGIRGTDLLVG